MSDSQTNFRSGDMIGTPKVTATPATIARLVAPRKPVGPTVEQSSLTTEVDEEDA